MIFSGPRSPHRGEAIELCLDASNIQFRVSDVPREVNLQHVRILFTDGIRVEERRPISLSVIDI